MHHFIEYIMHCSVLGHCTLYTTQPCTVQLGTDSLPSRLSPIMTPPVKSEAVWISHAPLNQWLYQETMMASRRALRVHPDVHGGCAAPSNFSEVHTFYAEL